MPRKIGHRAAANKLRYYPASSAGPMMALRTIDVPVVVERLARRGGAGSVAYLVRQYGLTKEEAVFAGHLAAESVVDWYTVYHNNMHGAPDRVRALRFLTKMQQYGHVNIGKMRVWNIHACNTALSLDHSPYFHIAATVGETNNIQDAFTIGVSGSTVSVAEWQVRRGGKGRPCRCGAVNFDSATRIDPPLGKAEEVITMQNLHLILHEGRLCRLQIMAIDPLYIQDQLWDIAQSFGMTRGESHGFASGLTGMIYWCLEAFGDEMPPDIIQWLDWKIRPENAEKNIVHFAEEVWRPLVIAGRTLRQLREEDAKGVGTFERHCNTHGTTASLMFETWKTGGRWRPKPRGTVGRARSKRVLTNRSLG